MAFDGQTEPARAEFEEVIRLAPNHSVAHLNLGVALFKAGRVAKARQEFATTLKLNPQNRLAADYLQQLDRAPAP